MDPIKSVPQATFPLHALIVFLVVKTPILDQCVFIKGFRARRIPFWFRKMAAGAPSLREFEAFIKPGGDTKNSQRMQINRFLNVGKVGYPLL